jgi:hypothetical protein
MLVLAPAACILSGIALSEVFGVLTRSIKFQLSKLFVDSSAAVRLLLTLFSLSLKEFKQPFDHLLTFCFFCNYSQVTVAQRVLQIQQKLKIGTKILKQLPRKNHQRRTERRKKKWQRVFL